MHSVCSEVMSDCLADLRWPFFFFEHHFVVFCPLFTRDYIFLAISSSLAVWLERGGRELLHTFCKYPSAKVHPFSIWVYIVERTFYPMLCALKFFPTFQHLFMPQRISVPVYSSLLRGVFTKLINRFFLLLLFLQIEACWKKNLGVRLHYVKSPQYMG